MKGSSNANKQVLETEEFLGEVELMKFVNQFYESKYSLGDSNHIPMVQIWNCFDLLIDLVVAFFGACRNPLALVTGIEFLTWNSHRFFQNSWKMVRYGIF